MPTLPATASRPALDGASPTLRAAILGSGAFAPEGRLTNADLEAMVATSDAWIVERTGIRERRRVAEGETTAMLAAEAGRRALADAGVDRVDALILATCSAESPVPPTSSLVQRELGLAGIPAFDINAACTGYLYALGVGDALIRAGALKSILVIGVEVMTTLLDFTDRGTCVLFGDGAGASVLGAATDGGLLALEWGADGRESELITYAKKPGEPESSPAVRMEGRATYRLAVEQLAAVARRVVAKAGWSIEDVDAVVPHQANLRIIESVMGRVGLPMSTVVVNIDRYGNTSAASIPMALEEADSSGRLKPGDRVLMLAFGAGVTWAGAALQWTRRRP